MATTYRQLQAEKRMRIKFWQDEGLRARLPASSGVRPDVDPRTGMQ